MNDLNCPHCSHSWSGHGQAGVDYASPCHCGCLWRRPALHAPPLEPLTPRQELLAILCDTIWSAFEAQHNSDGPFTPYVDRGMDMIDASGAGVNMDAVAEALLVKLESLGVIEEIETAKEVK